MSIIIGLKLTSGMDLIGKAPEDFKLRDNFILEQSAAVAINNVNGNISANIIPLTILDSQSKNCHDSYIHKTMYLFPYEPKQEILTTYLRHTTGLIMPNTEQSNLRLT